MNVPLNKQSGNMYDWVTHTWNPIAGECSHKCNYCYVESMKSKSVIRKKYSGKVTLSKNELKTDLGSGNTIFVQNMSDLFTSQVPPEVVKRVLKHCNRYPKNTYLFQSKNPANMLLYEDDFPPNSIVCTTIETNRTTKQFSVAPHPETRADFMSQLKTKRKSITIEPVMDFDLNELIALIVQVNPEFVSIGADSKKCGLPEPSSEKLKQLIRYLDRATTLKIKSNLSRLLIKEE